MRTTGTERPTGWRPTAAPTAEGAGLKEAPVGAGVEAAKEGPECVVCGSRVDVSTDATAGGVFFCPGCLEWELYAELGVGD